MQVVRAVAVAQRVQDLVAASKRVRMLVLLGWTLQQLRQLPGTLALAA